MSSPPCISRKKCFQLLSKKRNIWWSIFHFPHNMLMGYLKMRLKIPILDADKDLRFLLLQKSKYLMSLKVRSSCRKRHSYEQVQFYVLLLNSPAVCVAEFCQALDQLLTLGWYSPTYLLQVQIIHLESQKAEQPKKILTKVNQILHDVLILSNNQILAILFNVRLKKLSNLASIEICIQNYQQIKV